MQLISYTHTLNELLINAVLINIDLYTYRCTHSCFHTAVVKNVVSTSEHIALYFSLLFFALGTFFLNSALPR